MKKHIRTIASMLMVMMIVCSFMTVNASAAYDPPDAGVNQVTSIGWVLYIDGEPYEIEDNTYVGWGSSGRNVYVVQLACNTIASTYNVNCNCGDTDGIYGANTNNGIKNFQTYCNTIGLYGYNQSVDGIVGPVSWNRLASILHE